MLSALITRRFGGFHDRFDLGARTGLTILPSKFSRTGSPDYYWMAELNPAYQAQHT